MARFGQAGHLTSRSFPFRNLMGCSYRRLLHRPPIQLGFAHNEPFLGDQTGIDLSDRLEYRSPWRAGSQSSLGLQPPRSKTIVARLREPSISRTSG